MFNLCQFYNPQRAAWSSHKLECEGISRVTPNAPSDHVRLMSRLSRKRKVDIWCKFCEHFLNCFGYILGYLCCRSIAFCYRLISMCYQSIFLQLFFVSKKNVSPKNPTESNDRATPTTDGVDWLIASNIDIFYTC